MMACKSLFSIHREYIVQGRLHTIMVRTAEEVIDEVDAVCWVVDAKKLDSAVQKNINIWSGGLGKIAEMLSSCERLTIALNKVDTIRKSRLLPLIQSFAQKIPKAELIPISAKTSDNVEALVSVWKSQMPCMPPMFPLDQLTDISERFLVSEIIREKVFRLTNQEIPYSVAVQIESFENKEPLVEIHARIFVEKILRGLSLGKG